MSKSHRAVKCVARKLREVLTNPLLRVHGQTLNVTVSIGVTSLETCTELSNTTPVELLRSADRGLYRSKQSGKDQITATSAWSAQCQALGLGPKRAQNHSLKDRRAAALMALKSVVCHWRRTFSRFRDQSLEPT
jgi:predicted signal transduction protein with EAL and GGDEF domain